MSSPVTPEDLKTLQTHLASALATVADTRWEGLYPQYPEAIPSLMGYIMSSPWGDHAYQPSRTSEILSRLDRADLAEIRSVLTAISRSERFGDGNWEAFLKSGTLTAVVQRAGEFAF